MFLRRLVCPGFFSIFFPPSSVVPSPRRLVVLFCTAPLGCVRVTKGVGRHDGSDNEEAGHASRAELATFKQDMANEVAQLQAALQ